MTQAMTKAKEEKVTLELTMEELGHIILALYAVDKPEMLKEAKESMEEEGVKISPLSDKEEQKLFEKLMVPYRW